MIGASATSPQIYVACLAAYNNGRLHGEWIDANQDADDIAEQVQAMLKRSPEPGAEEWAIHDYEGFGSYHLNEHESFETAAKLAALIREHGEVFAELMSHFCGDIEQAEKAITEDYQGEWVSLKDWAEDWLTATGELANIPESLSSYINFSRYAHDAECGGDTYTIKHAGKIHVFNNR